MRKGNGSLNSTALASSPDPSVPWKCVCGRPCRGRRGLRSHKRSCRAYSVLAPDLTSGINSTGLPRPLLPPPLRTIPPPRRLPLLLASSRRFYLVSSCRRCLSGGSKRTPTLLPSVYFVTPSSTSTHTRTCCRIYEYFVKANFGTISPRPARMMHRGRIAP